MAFIIKQRARKILDSGKPSVAYHPHGVGGLPTKDPALIVHIGEHKIVMTMAEINSVFDDLTKLEKSSEQGARP